MSADSTRHRHHLTSPCLSQNSLKCCVIMCVIYSGGLYSEMRIKLLSCAVPAPAGRGDFQQITFYIIVRTSHHPPSHQPPDTTTRTGTLPLSARNVHNKQIKSLIYVKPLILEVCTNMKTSLFSVGTLIEQATMNVKCRLPQCSW